MRKIEPSTVNFESVTKAGIYKKLRMVSQLDDLQIERCIELLWQICPTPSALGYPTSYYEAMTVWINVHIENSGKLTQLQQNEYDNLRVVLDEIVRLSKSSQKISSLPDNASRSVLRNYLTDFPLYSSLLIINADSNQERKLWWLWFLFRLTRLNREFDRATSKKIEKCRTSLEMSNLMPLKALKHDSNKALAKHCERVYELTSFRRNFKEPINKRKHLPYRSDNEYVEHLSLPDGYVAQIHTPTDLEGETLNTHYSFSTIKKHTNSQLSELDYQRQFQHKRTGIENAITRANLKLPLSNEALTTSEFASWLKGHIPDLFDQSLPQDELPHWFLLFFRVFIGKQAKEFKLYNDGSSSSQLSQFDGIHYVLDKEKGCLATLLLSSKLFKGIKPKENIEKYYAAQHTIKIDIPWPLSSFLNQLLRQVPSNKRHNITVSTFLNTTSKNHEKWLKSLIKQDRKNVPYKLTTSTIHNSFEYFSTQSLPSVVRDYSGQTGSVIMHYVNMEAQSVSELLNASWFDFLNNCGLGQSTGWSADAKKKANKPIATKDDQIGSAITLKHTYLFKVFELLLGSLEPPTRRHTDLVKLSQKIGLYIHIRASVELAIRPVSNPYSTALDFISSEGVMVVQDKRTHSKEERRLLIMTPQLSTLISEYQRFCYKVDPKFDQTRQASVAIYDGFDWLPLSPKLVKASLSAIEPGCFRHICAYQVIGFAFSQQHRFEQQFLNQKMNHRKRGLDTLGQFSLCSIPQLVEHQRSIQDALMTEAPFSEIRRYWSEVEKWDEVVRNVMSSFKV